MVELRKLSINVLLMNWEVLNCIMKEGKEDDENLEVIPLGE